MKTIQELEKEKKSIEEEIERLKEEEVNQKRKRVAEKIDSFTEEQKNFLLSLLEHDRTSCSDKHIANGLSYVNDRWRCRKCMLTEILNGEHGADYDFNISVEIYKVDS